MQAVKVGRPRRASRLRPVLVATGVILAVGLAFSVGYLVAGDVSFVSRDVVIVGGGIASLFIALQLLVQIAIISRAEGTETDALNCSTQLFDQGEELRLLDILSEATGQECSPRQVAAAAADFATAQLGCARTTVWRLDGDGLPVPFVTRELGATGSADAGRPEDDRAGLARKASRSGDLLVVEAGSTRPKPVSEVEQNKPFSMFVPLVGTHRSEGVIEIDFAKEQWRESYQAIMPILSRHLGIALARARQYEEMQRRADIDFVTGAYNYRFMQSYLHRVIEASAKRDRLVAVIFLDIDNFKAFNDTLGHGAGDRVLQTVADQLKLMTERVGIVGRSGGDEFMVVLPQHSAQQARALIGAFQDWLSTSAPPVNGMFRIRVSCGHAVFPHDAQSRQELLATADARLYHEKSQRGGRSLPQGGNGAGERTIGVYGLLDRLVDDLDRVDNYTKVHSEKTAEYAAGLAEALELSPAPHRILRLASLLHDVGKIGVPARILCKRGALTPEELGIVRHQVEIASRLIVDLPNSTQVQRVVRHHRERWDGSGYPDGLAGESIPYLSRVLAVADSFAAITLDRPHKAALSSAAAYEELVRSAGTQLDPDMVAAFSSVVTTDESEEAIDRVPSAR